MTCGMAVNRIRVVLRNTATKWGFAPHPNTGNGFTKSLGITGAFFMPKRRRFNLKRVGNLEKWGKKSHGCLR
jgi:hypothetical protein